MIPNGKAAMEAGVHLIFIRLGLATLKQLVFGSTPHMPTANLDGNAARIDIYHDVFLVSVG